MRVTIRADATQAVGAGHVMRCLALAEELARKGAEVSWQGTITVPWVSSLLKARGWSVYPTPEVVHWDAGAARPDAIVVDSYVEGHGYREAVMNLGIPLVAIVDDFHDDLGPADLWVNPGVRLGWDSPSRGMFLDGPDYLLIRSEIRALRELRVFRPRHLQQRPRVTLLLGGTDFAGLGDQMESFVFRMAQEFRVTMGPVPEPSTTNVERLPGGPALLRSAALSDLAIAPSGVSSWELLHIGTPLALIQATDNQKGNYQWMVEQKLAFGLGTVEQTSLLADLELRIRKLIKGGYTRPRSLSQVVDGWGAARVADAVLDLLG